jgi:hypothetical protein
VLTPTPEKVKSCGLIHANQTEEKDNKNIKQQEDKFIKKSKAVSSSSQTSEFCRSRSNQPESNKSLTYLSSRSRDLPSPNPMDNISN